jgi:hypothetical protein
MRMRTGADPAGTAAGVCRREDQLGDNEYVDRHRGGVTG